MLVLSHNFILYISILYSVAAPVPAKTFPQKTTDKPDEYRNEKWEQTKSRVFKSNMGRFATTIGVGSDYPMADAKLISEEENEWLSQYQNSNQI